MVVHRSSTLPGQEEEVERIFRSSNMVGCSPTGEKNYISHENGDIGSFDPFMLRKANPLTENDEEDDYDFDDDSVACSSPQVPELYWEDLTSFSGEDREDIDEHMERLIREDQTSPRQQSISYDFLESNPDDVREGSNDLSRFGSEVINESMTHHPLMKMMQSTLLGYWEPHGSMSSACKEHTHGDELAATPLTSEHRWVVALSLSLAILGGVSSLS